MSFKVVRNAGSVVCFGPNEESYKPQLKAGDVLTVETEQPLIQTVISSAPAWAIKRVLTQMGLRAATEQAVAQADQDTKDMWEYATTYRRTSPFTLAIANALNKTDADLDELFTIAKQIEDSNNGN